MNRKRGRVCSDSPRPLIDEHVRQRRRAFSKDIPLESQSADVSADRWQSGKTAANESGQWFTFYPGPVARVLSRSLSVKTGISGLSVPRTPARAGIAGKLLESTRVGTNGGANLPLASWIRA